MKITSALALPAYVVLVALVAACATPTVLNITAAPVRVGKDRVTDQEVKEAIMRAGTSLGWSMRDNGPGKLIGTMTARGKTAVVSIGYYPSMYNIRYKDSINLHYKYAPVSDMMGAVHDPNHATIDPLYNEWVQSLDGSIQRELAALR
jgi:hypothetical protein